MALRDRMDPIPKHPPGHQSELQKALKGAAVEYVEWVDSAGTPGWCTPDDVEHAGTEMRCATVGFVINETETALALALNKSNSPRCARPFGELITIPKVAITMRVKVTS